MRTKDDKNQENLKAHEPMSKVKAAILFGAPLLRPPQTRKHCCGNIVADANVSLFARARNICCTRKFASGTQKMFLNFFRTFCVRNKCFPKCFLVCAARKQNICFASHSFARRGNITSNNVSATMFPRLRGPLFSHHWIKKLKPWLGLLGNIRNFFCAAPCLSPIELKAILALRVRIIWFLKYWLRFQWQDVLFYPRLLSVRFSH